MTTAAKPPILTIVGPTATGKTALAVAVARRLGNVEIISADSRQVYRFLDIGSAKPSPAILREVRHHFVDIVNPDEAYSAGRFGHDAANTIADIIARGAVPVIVGGSGLYLRALTDGLHAAPGENAVIRAELERRAETEGTRALLEELKKCDPVTASRIEMTHTRRIIRALEVFLDTGTPLSVWQADQASRAFEPRMIGLRWERAALYARIEERVDEMMAAGLLDEVVALQAREYTDTMQSLNTPGYKELFAYLRGETTLERAVELIKQHTRNYAKRQVTWFARDKRITWLGADRTTNFDALAKRLIETT